MLTVDDLKAALPKNLQANATQEFADKLNLVATDPEEARAMRDNFMTYSKVMVEGKYKTEDYLNAVAYVTFKLMGHTNQDAYKKAFPDRYQALVARGASTKDISAYVAMYHKNKIVNTILEQAVVPMWLLNQDTYQKAINKQLELMTSTDVSPMVQQLAANSILLHLKQPETKKIELDVSLKNGGGLNELRETMAELAEQQARLIADGAGAKTVSRVPLRMGRDEPITDVMIPPVSQQKIPEPVRTIFQTQAAPAFKQAMEDVAATGTGAVKVTLEQGELKTSKVSLFDTKPESALEIKSQAVNYARCCDNAIEDCSCVEPEHIYLPTVQDVPARKRVSLFDDPADMP